MVRIEENKLIVEIETNSPKELYHELLNCMITCVQATQESGTQDKMEELPTSLVFFMELYKALLPDVDQVDKMFGKTKQ